MNPRHDQSGSTLDDVQRHFAEFADEYANLSLYQRICDEMSRDQLAELVLAAGPGQARPVLFLAALHDLVLRRPEVAAARWYSSVVGADHVPSGDPWPDVRTTILEHQDELRETIATRTTQTNEVNRATYIALLMHLATRDVPERPVALVELGASAGLLLATDRFRVEIGDAVCGPPDSPVVCRGEDRSDPPVADLSSPPVAAAEGVDLAPVDLQDVDQVRWLEACLWPDLPERLDRFRAAVGLLRADPPRVRVGDLVDGAAAAIDSVLAQAPDAHLVVTTSWALTYVERDRRRDLAAGLAGVAADGRPVSWTSAEPEGCVPGIPEVDRRASGTTTVLGLRSWREGRERPARRLGTCHSHGYWYDLAP